MLSPCLRKCQLNLRKVRGRGASTGGSALPLRVLTGAVLDRRQIRQSTATTLQFGEVAIAHHPRGVTPQLDRLVVVRDLVDDRSEDRRAVAGVEHDGRDAERAGAVDERLMFLHD